MTVSKILLLIVTGALGTFAFALVFRIRKRLIVWTVLSGLLTTALYVLCAQLFTLEFFQYLFPALFATAFAEALARLTKAPTTPFIVCPLIPLVPGSALFYTMYHFILGDMTQFHEMLMQTLRISAGLAVGIICVSAVAQFIQYVKRLTGKTV